MMTERLTRTAAFAGALSLVVIALASVAVPAALCQASAAQAPAAAPAGSADAPAPPVAILPAPRFDVISIKPDNGDSARASIRTLQDRFTATNVPLLPLIEMAYGLQDFQIIGAPSWLNSNRYNIEATMDDSTASQLQKLDMAHRMDVVERMIAGLIADRCKLTFHHESRELQEYALVVAKSGLKIQEAKPGDTYPNGLKGSNGAPLGAGVLRGGIGLLAGQALPISGLVRGLTGLMGGIIVDKTGLTGKYDFTLHWAQDVNQGSIAGAASQSPGAAPEVDSLGPTLFTALEEQLGLKLESQKGPVDVIVIDHVEMPSEN